MTVDPLQLTAGRSMAMGRTHLGGHAIADHGNIVGLESHCCNATLDRMYEVWGKQPILVSKRPSLSFGSVPSVWFE